MLTPDEHAALAASIAESSPAFSERLGLPFDVEIVQQPFFTRHQVVRVRSSAISPEQTLHVALGERGEMAVLTGHDATFNALAVLDPPGLILDEETARDYGLMCDLWVSPDATGEHALGSFDDLPLREGLDSALLDRLRDDYQDLIGPTQLRADEEGFRLRKWLVRDRQLIRRELDLTHDGRVRRVEEVVGTDLPLEE